MTRLWLALSVLAGLFLIGFGGFVVMAGKADDSRVSAAWG